MFILHPFSLFSPAIRTYCALFTFSLLFMFLGGCYCPIHSFDRSWTKDSVWLSHCINHTLPQSQPRPTIFPIWNMVKFNQFLWNHCSPHACLACAYSIEKLQILNFVWHLSLYLELESIVSLQHVWSSFFLMLRFTRHLSFAERKQSSFWNSNHC